MWEAQYLLNVEVGGLIRFVPKTCDFNVQYPLVLKSQREVVLLLEVLAPTSSMRLCTNKRMQMQNVQWSV